MVVVSGRDGTSRLSLEHWAVSKANLHLLTHSPFPGPRRVINDLNGFPGNPPEHGVPGAPDNSPNLSTLHHLQRPAGSG